MPRPESEAWMVKCQIGYDALRPLLASSVSLLASIFRFDMLSVGHSTVLEDTVTLVEKW